MKVMTCLFIEAKKDLLYSCGRALLNITKCVPCLAVTRVILQFHV